MRVTLTSGALTCASVVYSAFRVPCCQTPGPIRMKGAQIQLLPLAKQGFGRLFEEGYSVPIWVAMFVGRVLSCVHQLMG